MHTFKLWLEIFHPDDVIKINQSFDNHGFDSSISLDDIMPLLRKKINKNHKVLDYGAGRNPKISKLLTKMGFDVTPHEIGKNQTNEHDPDALDKKYDVVLALNVLNHLPDHNKIMDSLAEIKSVLKPKGCCIASLPKEPRLIKLSRNKLKETLDDLFPKHQVKTKPEKGSLLIMEKD